MSFRWAITLASLLVPPAVNAMSLTDALETARQDAITLRSLAAETRQAEAAHQQSSQAYLPTISADTSWLRAESSLITGIALPVPGTPASIEFGDPGPVEGTLAGVQVAQPLFNADALRLREAATLEVEARRAAEQWGHQAIRLEVSRRYFNVLREQEHAQAAQSAYRAARRFAALARASYREGLTPRVDTEQADAELAAAQARIEHARAATKRARLELRRLLGLPTSAQLELSTRLPRPLPPEQLGDSLPRSDLQAQEMAVEAARASTRASRAQWLPRVNLLARQQWIQGHEPLAADLEGWLVAINVQWTLFDGLGRQGRIAESVAEQQQASIELDSTRRRIEQEQAIAMSLWESSWASWHAAQEGAEAAQRAVQLASGRYAEGLGSMTELLAAQARLDRQRVALVDARYQAVLASMNYHLQNGYDPLLAVEGQLP